MSIEVFLIRADVPDAAGYVYTIEALNTMITSLRELPHVERAWVDGDELKVRVSGNLQPTDFLPMLAKRGWPAKRGTGDGSGAATPSESAGDSRDADVRFQPLLDGDGSHQKNSISGKVSPGDEVHRRTAEALQRPRDVVRDGGSGSEAVALHAFPISNVEVRAQADRRQLDDREPEDT